MKETYKNISYDKLWSPCGDPFVDAGGFALKFLSEKFPDKDILNIVDFVTDIYVNKWNSSVQKFFFNSKITNPSIKDSAKKASETHDFFVKILNGKDSCTEGYCRILGHKAKLYNADRRTYPLGGAQSFTNFFHSFETGLMVSPEAIIRLFFVPFGVEIIDGKLAIINSNYFDISYKYVSKCCAKNLMRISSGISDSMLKSDFKSHATSFFKFVESFILENVLDNNIRLNLYVFDNGKDLSVNYYSLPENVFLFYSETQKNCYREEWNEFVSHFYVPFEKSYNYDESRGVFIVGGKNNKKTYHDDDYHTFDNEFENEDIDSKSRLYYENVIYDKLLSNSSILKQILKWSVNNLFNLQLLSCYLFNVRKMKNETINKINTIADFIIDNSAEVDMKKILTRLNGITSASLLRRFILKIVEKNFSIGNEEPIITVKDYTDYLFPDTSSWREIRDVLLIDIYQKLHEKKLKVDVDEDKLFDFEDDED